MKQVNGKKLQKIELLSPTNNHLELNLSKKHQEKLLHTVNKFSFTNNVVCTLKLVLESGT